MATYIKPLKKNPSLESLETLQVLQRLKTPYHYPYGTIKQPLSVLTARRALSHGPAHQKGVKPDLAAGHLTRPFEA